GRQGKVAFLFPGQGSQYVGMLAELARSYSVVADTFAEANGVLEPLIGGKLTDRLWPGPGADVEAASRVLLQTEICQPAMLAADVAMFRLLSTFGVRPDLVVGHSLGE